jgi:hypothetical protein
MKRVLDFFISNKFLVVSIFILISFYSLVIPNSNDENEKFHIPKTLKIHGQFIGLDNDSRIRIKVLNQVKNDTITLLFDPIAEIQIKKNWIELNEGETIWFDLWEHDSELYNRDSRIKTQFRAYSLHKNDKTIFSIEDYSKMVKLSVNIVDPQQKLKNFLFALSLIIAFDFIGKNKDLFFDYFEKISAKADLYLDHTKKYPIEIQEYFDWLRLSGFQGNFRLTSDYIKSKNKFSKNTEYHISQSKFSKWTLLSFGVTLLILFIIFLFQKNSYGATSIIPQILMVFVLALFLFKRGEKKFILNAIGIVLPNEEKIPWSEIEYTIIHDKMGVNELLVKTFKSNHPKIIQLNGLDKGVKKISQLIEVLKEKK